MYTREAHPNTSTAPCGSTEDLGWGHPSSQTQSVEQRAQRVRWLKDEMGLDFPFLVDDMNNTVRNTYFPSGFYVAWVIDCDGRVLAHEPWAWAVQGTQWCGLPLPDMSGLDAVLDSYLASPSACYRGVEELESKIVVPVVTDLVGIGNNHWVSDVTISNPSSLAITAEVTLLLSNRAKLDSRLVRTMTIEGGHTRNLDGVLKTTFETTGVGALLIEANGELVVESKISNLRSPTVTTQVVTAIRDAQILRSDQIGHLLNLESSDRARTNLNLLNLGTAPIDAEITVWTSRGSLLGRRQIRIGGENFAQLNRLLYRFGAVTEIGARAEVLCLSNECSLVASASVVNNQSGDARFVVPHLNTWAVDSLVASVTKGDGWSSSLYLHNQSELPVTATLEARKALDSNLSARAEIELPPSSSTVVTDPLTLLGLDAADATLKITGNNSRGLVAVSHMVLEREDAGDLSFAVPALDQTAADTIRADRIGHLLNLEENGPDGLSTDLRIVNIRSFAAEIDLRFFDSSGSERGRLRPTVGGSSVLLLESVLSEIGAVGESDLRVEIRSSGRILAAAITHDGGGGDRLYQPAWVELDVVRD